MALACKLASTSLISRAVREPYDDPGFNTELTYDVLQSLERGTAGRTTAALHRGDRSMPSKRSISSASWALVCVALVSCGGSYDPGSGLYHDDGNGFFIRLPAGWQESSSVPGALITVGSPDESAQINLVVQELPQSVTFDQYVEQLVARWGSAGARKVEEGETLMGGVGGFWTVRTLTVGGQRFTAANYSVMKGPKVYSVIGIVNEADFPTYRPVFEEVAGSLMFID
jgi:hypothetical protein